MNNPPFVQTLIVGKLYCRRSESTHVFFPEIIHNKRHMVWLYAIPVNKPFMVVEGPSVFVLDTEHYTGTETVERTTYKIVSPQGIGYILVDFYAEDIELFA